MNRHSPLQCIVPPGLLVKLARHGTEEQRNNALNTLSIDQSFRLTRAENAARRPVATPRISLLSGGRGQPQRTIYDQKNSPEPALGSVARAEGGPAVDDPAVNEAYDGFGATYGFYWDTFKRDSIDNQGMPILGLVHFDQNYDNAFWDGQGHMFFGDGDGQILTRLTKSVDVIGHELTHGVTQHEAGLAYSSQSGALNESISDVFGSLVKQYSLKQSATDADWLIGADVVGPELAPALRSMKAPGTANKHDDQPADMDHFVQTTADHGGVHTNSGIPNHAFYVVATTLGGNAWEAAGKIWYGALRDSQIHPNSGFHTFAQATQRQAQQIFGAGKEVDAVNAGWEAVKVPTN